MNHAFDRASLAQMLTCNLELRSRTRRLAQ